MKASAPLWPAFGVVGLFTVSVNLLNYARDAAVVARFGASAAGDAFFAAFLVPGLILQVLVPGTLAAALVPVYEEARARSEETGAELLFAVGGMALAGLVVAATLAVLAADRIVAVLLPGFDAATQQLTAEALRFLLPGTVLLVLAGLAGAVLNAHRVFALPAAAGAGVAIAVLATLTAAPAAGVGRLALAAAVGMAVQLGVVVAVLRRRGVALRPLRPAAATRLPELRRVLRLSGPLIAFTVLSQAVTLIERWWASRLGPGTLSHLTLAQKVASLPLFLVGGSMVVVLFPRLSAAAGDARRFASDLAAGARVVVPALLLCTAWLIGAAPTVVTLLYRHGAFSAADADATALLLRCYALGLPPAGAGMLLLKALHARQDVRAPIACTAAALPVYLAGGALLVPRLGAAALGLVLSATTALTCALYLRALSRRHPGVASRQVLSEWARWLPAALAALAVAAGLEHALGTFAAGPVSTLWRLALIGAASGAAFALAAAAGGRLAIARAVRREA